jgi:hypothetical protein
LERDIKIHVLDNASYSMSAPSLVPTKEVDYLDEDKPIRGQNYVCLSFLSPEDVLANKEAFLFTKYVAKFSKDVKELMDNLVSKYPQDEGIVNTIRENHDYLFDTAKMQENYEFFKSVHGSDAEKEFNEQNDFRTSVRGIKVRGVFDTIKEAQQRADLLKRMGDKFNIYVGQVGCWCPWSPNPEDMEEAEYAETQLNTLMKKYKENMVLRDQHYEERKAERIASALKDKQLTSVVEEAPEPTPETVGEPVGAVEALADSMDTWMERRGDN